MTFRCTFSVHLCASMARTLCSFFCYLFLFVCLFVFLLLIAITRVYTNIKDTEIAIFQQSICCELNYQCINCLAWLGLPSTSKISKCMLLNTAYAILNWQKKKNENKCECESEPSKNELCLLTVICVKIVSSNDHLCKISKKKKFHFFFHKKRNNAITIAFKSIEY